MITPRRKKRLILSVSGLAVLAFVWLWHAGGLLKGPGSVRKDAYRAGIKTIALQTPPVIVTKKIGALASDDIHADESKQPIVRKKLPEPQPLVVAKQISDATPDGVRLAESTLCLRCLLPRFRRQNRKPSLRCRPGKPRNRRSPHPKRRPARCLDRRLPLPRPAPSLPSRRPLRHRHLRRNPQRRSLSQTRP